MQPGVVATVLHHPRPLHFSQFYYWAILFKIKKKRKQILCKNDFFFFFFFLLISQNVTFSGYRNPATCIALKVFSYLIIIYKLSHIQKKKIFKKNNN